MELFNFFRANHEFNLKCKKEWELRKKLRSARRDLIEWEMRKRLSSKNPLIIMMDELPEVKDKIIDNYEDNCNVSEETKKEIDICLKKIVDQTIEEQK